jgi:hypothetical protein
MARKEFLDTERSYRDSLKVICHIYVVSNARYAPFHVV